MPLLHCCTDSCLLGAWHVWELVTCSSQLCPGGSRLQGGGRQRSTNPGNQLPLQNPPRRTASAARKAQPPLKGRPRPSRPPRPHPRRPSSPRACGACRRWCLSCTPCSGLTWARTCLSPFCCTRSQSRGVRHTLLMCTPVGLWGFWGHACFCVECAGGVRMCRCPYAQVAKVVPDRRAFPNAPATAQTRAKFIFSPTSHPQARLSRDCLARR